MNKQRLKWTPVFAAAAFALAACGGTSTPAAAPAATMAPGMVMPDGSTMGAAQPSATSASPSAPAAMVCGDEVRSDITKVLSLRTAPATSATWVGHVYTCRYRLPMGPLVLSVRESPTDAAAHAAYLTDRARLGSTVDTAGLGKYAYRTASGTVGLVKDKFTLTVDATALPGRFGAQGQKRADLAYEVASVVLGCWTGDDD